MVNTQLDVKVKVSIYRSSFVPTLSYDHKLWAVTRIIRLKIQAAEINFLQNVLGSPSDSVRSMVVQEFWACPGGGPRDDPAHAGEIISLHWLIL